VTALVVASFTAAGPFRGAIMALRARERAIVGLWSPVMVDVPDGDATGERGIVATMTAAGIGAAIALYALIWWSAVIAYPFDSGARPIHSWPTFLIAPIEFGALIAGFAGVIAFLVRARLTRLHDSAFDLDEVAAAASDRFVLAARCDAGADANELLALLADQGAVHSRLIER
jgi:hypothetical protein